MPAARAAALRRALRPDLAVQDELPGREPHQAGNAAQQRCLAGAVRAADRKQLAGIEVKAQVGEDPAVAANADQVTRREPHPIASLSHPGGRNGPAQ